jgi:hypothetical protein
LPVKLAASGALLLKIGHLHNERVAGMQFQPDTLSQSPDPSMGKQELSALRREAEKLRRKEI